MCSISAAGMIQRGRLDLRGLRLRVNLAPLCTTAIHGRLIMSFSPCLRMWNRSFSGFESRSFTSFG
jgi:hypothetical protein